MALFPLEVGQFGAAMDYYNRGGKTWNVAQRQEKIEEAQLDSNNSLVEQEIVIKLAPRNDGGVRVWSDDVPGLALSGREQDLVLLDIGPTLIGLLEQKLNKRGP